VPIAAILLLWFLRWHRVRVVAIWHPARATGVRANSCVRGYCRLRRREQHAPPPPNNGTPPGSYTVTVYAFTESNTRDGNNANADAHVDIPLTVN